MFGKKKVAPTTVAEAIAPFKEVKDNLIAVIGSKQSRIDEAARRKADAEAYALQVQKDENAAAEAADKELKQAQKVVEALSAILGEPSQEQLKAEQASADA
ncbi:hypothetical protein MAL1_00110 [Bacteriophage DSS3_MAL1]|nr:hypothetical protein MAL1_00110 [Bacteriophage DSS3_MAL1]